MSIATTADVAARIRQARAEGTRLRLAGGGGWMDAGAPCDAPVTLSLAALSGIVEYEPGDLTLTARAGTPLAEIDRVTGERGQWLPLDPAGAPTGTLGATVATGSYGPLAAAFGTPRNQVLGCEVVTGAGDVVRAGGRVVKNVAGFDLTRLMIGAWGSLGALTEVTVRLRARPEADATIAVALPAQADLERLQRWLRTTEFAPFAAELLSPALVAKLGLVTVNLPAVLLRFGGGETLVRAALRAASSLGDSVPVETAVWRALAAADAPGSATLRLSDATSGLARLWGAAVAVTERSGGVAHANVMRGVVRCVLNEASRGTLDALPPATVIAERLPAGLWRARVPDAVTRTLTQGVRRVFDPDHLLNPGIMGVT